MIKQQLSDLVDWGQLVHKLLALDQASVTTGWAYFEDDKLKEFGKFTTHEDDIGDRLFYIKNQVKNLISKYEIDQIYSPMSYQARHKWSILGQPIIETICLIPNSPFIQIFLSIIYFLFCQLLNFSIPSHCVSNRSFVAPVSGIH